MKHRELVIVVGDCPPHVLFYVMRMKGCFRIANICVHYNVHFLNQLEISDNLLNVNVHGESLWNLI